MQKRSSKGHLISITHKLKRVRTLAAFRAYTSSDSFVAMLGDMDYGDRVIAFGAVYRAWREFDTSRPIPEQRETKLRWTPALIERLRAAERKHGTDEGIARELRIPVKTAKVARWKYVGPRRPLHGSVAATASVQA